MPAAPQPNFATLARRSLRRKILRATLTSHEWRAILSEAASEIQRHAKPTATEATIEGVFERVLYSRLREIGVQFHPEKQSGVNIKRHLTRGRTDSRIGAVVIEYKRPSLLKSTVEIDKALGQLKEYLIAITGKTPGAPFVGILTNGLVIIEVRATGGIITDQSATEKISGEALLRLTQYFVSLALTALTSSNLIREFCGSQTDGALFKTARILNTILSNPQPKTRMLHSEWEELFRLAQGDQSQQKRIEQRRESLAALFNVDITDAAAEYRALFSLHTAYAILLKFIAYRTVSDMYLGERLQDYKSLSLSSDASLRAFCKDLEDGDIFRQLNILNLLEGDFFSWYCDKKQWTRELADSIRSMLSILARYEEVGKIFEANEAPDLFRELYQAAVPRIVRSTFGEFYTPYWLAEHVLESALPRGNWRALDPCCGSGTFVIAAIEKLRAECKSKNLNDRETLRNIVDRVVAVDLNPLGVLTTRINYFIHICNLLDKASGPLLIPVFLGDAAAIPERITLDRIECLSVTLKTLKTPIKAILPVSLVQNTIKFTGLMRDYENNIKAQNQKDASAVLLRAIHPSQKPFSIHKVISELTNNLIELEQNGWNGIWARIVSNYLTTACLGSFTVVIGNPPWIDWKNLPEKYRGRIKDMCIERGLFSGAGRTGGINLNICALISYVAMTNWLDRDGRLAFLMPRELANQASYEGWRRLGGKWRFLEFHDWSKAGHPFDPVKEDFMTFIVGSGTGGGNVPVLMFKKKAKTSQKASEWKTLSIAHDNLNVAKGVAGQVIHNKTAFTFASDQAELREFALIAGECEYVGREGIEFYPQELLLFKFSADGPKTGTVWVHNIQVQKSKYRIPRRRILLETQYLYPLTKGPEIGVYEHSYSGLIVAFPYEKKDPLRPLPSEAIRSTSPHLLHYYEQARETIEKQTKGSDKIRGENPGEFYGLARTGPYSFGGVYVAYRDNTKWCATVVSNTKMPWGERKRFVFQNHAVSMCERKESGEFISEDEAHFVCAVLNTPIAERFIYASSDNRSFNIRPPIFIPIYDSNDTRHVQLAKISREAHQSPEKRDVFRAKSEELYLDMCLEESLDTTTARERIKDIKKGKVRLIGEDALQQKLASLLA
jgi:hypothetical protein